MFNPFHPFTPPLLDKFIKSGKPFFIRQFFSRGTDPLQENIKGSFLYSPYPNLADAEQHAGALPHDQYVKVYDYSIEADRQKLLIAAQQPHGYKIYTNVFYDNWKDQITGPLKMKVKKYIDVQLGWQPGGKEEVDFTIFVNYGTVYARLTFRKQEVRVELETIEKIVV